MTKTPADSLVELAKMAGGMVEAIAVQEAQMLHLVQAEMDALGNLVLAPAVKGKAKPTDAEVEAGFDNMPV